MKTMTCAQMGGSCDVAMTEATEKEMMDAGWKHVEEVHPDLAEKVKAMTPEETSKWAEDFHAKFEAAPEEAETEVAVEPEAEEEEPAA